MRKEYLIMRYNPKNNTNLSNGTIMYTKRPRDKYFEIPINTPVLIIGSGSKSGILLYKGLLKKVERKNQVDQMCRVTNPNTYRNIPVIKFNIQITEMSNRSIRHERYWQSVKNVIYPLLKYI